MATKEKILDKREEKKAALLKGVEEHRKYTNSAEFDMYAMARSFKSYTDKDATAECIPLAVKRAAFRLKYPNGNIEVSSPQYNEGLYSVRATVYIPCPIQSEDPANKSVNEMIAIGSGVGYFIMNGLGVLDCDRAYWAQNRAILAALHNAGFQGITEGKDTDEDGSFDMDADDEDSPSAAVVPPPVVHLVSSDSQKKGQKKNSKKTTEALDVEPINDSDTQAASTATAYVIPDDIAEALQKEVFYRGTSGTVNELYHNKLPLLMHLADQYENNRENLSDKQKEMFGACFTVISAVDESPELKDLLDS